jgi:intracellular sulfur oxidation DsrE/DsrF family protein
MKVHVIAPLLLALAGAASTTALAQDKLNVVYHVSEAERVAFVLNNIQNHIDGVGGPENVKIVLVVHGPAVTAFNDIEATEKVRQFVAFGASPRAAIAIANQ